MRTADDVIKRLRHDAAVDARHAAVGYLDRFDGVLEMPLCQFNVGVDLPDAIPQHRIAYFKYGGEVVWDKAARLDAVFGSSGSTRTIRDVARDLALPDPPPPAEPAEATGKANKAKATRNPHGDALLASLGLPRAARPPADREAPFDLDVDIEGYEPEGWTVRLAGRAWTVRTRVVFDPRGGDVRALSSLVARLAPAGSTAWVQADAHAAGNVYVGLIVSFDDARIPVTLVSADIGCGISVVPVVKHTAGADVDGLEYRTFVLGCMRRALKRGRIADQGATACEFVDQAARFYGDLELGAWLDEMAYVLRAMGVDPGGGGGREATLRYVARFAQTLGSSGNHFVELAADDHADPWLVVHSGSRGLGALVHGAIAYACRATCGGHEIATGPLAAFYRRAYDALNGFAKLNRVVCALAVLREMGAAEDAGVLLRAMRARPLFARAVEVAGRRDVVAALLSGLTHNGLKAFVNHRDRQVLTLACKGAIAVSRRGACAVVALRAGEGCVLFLLADPSCPWEEASVAEAAALEGYEAVTEADGVVMAGHGAGRRQSASKTSGASTFEDMAEYFRSVDVVANVAPGVIGDNPRLAYKPSAEVLPALPLAEAVSWSMLRTRVSHKEGISMRLEEIRRCAEHVRSADLAAQPLAALWHDINVCRRALPADLADERFEAAEALFAVLRNRYRD